MSGLTATVGRTNRKSRKSLGSTGTSWPAGKGRRRRTEDRSAGSRSEDGGQRTEERDQARTSVISDRSELPAGALGSGVDVGSAGSSSLRDGDVEHRDELVGLSVRARRRSAGSPLGRSRMTATSAWPRGILAARCDSTAPSAAATIADCASLRLLPDGSSCSSQVLARPAANIRGSRQQPVA